MRKGLKHRQKMSKTRRLSLSHKSAILEKSARTYVNNKSQHSSHVRVLLTNKYKRQNLAIECTRIRVVSPEMLGGKKTTTSDIQVGSEAFKNKERLSLGYERVISSRLDMLVGINENNVVAFVDSITDPDLALTRDETTIRDAILIYLVTDVSFSPETQAYLEEKALIPVRGSAQVLASMRVAMQRAKDRVTPLKSAKDHLKQKYGLEMTFSEADLPVEVRELRERAETKLREANEALEDPTLTDEDRMKYESDRRFYTSYLHAIDTKNWESVLEHEYEDAFRNHNYDELTALNTKIGKKLLDTYAAEYNVSLLDMARDGKWSKAFKQLAEDLRNFRYFAMLSNPATLLRNEVGNTIMRGLTFMTDYISKQLQLDEAYSRWGESKRQYRLTSKDVVTSERIRLCSRKLCR